MATDPRQAPGEASRIGFIVRENKRYIVHCAACGKGMASPTGARLTRRRAEAGLRNLGWSDVVDGLWRCPKHAPELPQREGVTG